MTNRECLKLAVNLVKAGLKIATPSQTKHESEHKRTYFTTKRGLMHGSISAINALLQASPWFTSIARRNLILITVKA